MLQHNWHRLQGQGDGEIGCSDASEEAHRSQGHQGVGCMRRITATSNTGHLNSLDIIAYQIGSEWEKIVKKMKNKRIQYMLTLSTLPIVGASTSQIIVAFVFMYLKKNSNKTEKR